MLRMLAHLPIAALPIAALLAGCGPRALDLPSDPVDRAATCGVVAAAEARSGTEIKSALPWEAQSRILHHALLAGAQGGDGFDAERAGAVSQRMAALQADIVAGRWRDLSPQCREAFPEAARTDSTLPEGRFDAQLACDELADFLVKALAGQDTDYGEQIGTATGLSRALDADLGPGLTERAGSDLAGQQALRRKALADVARAGSPAATLAQCDKRFG